jgi:hypothetical protein
MYKCVVDPNHATKVLRHDIVLQCSNLFNLFNRFNNFSAQDFPLFDIKIPCLLDMMQQLSLTFTKISLYAVTAHSNLTLGVEAEPQMAV